MSRQTNFYAAPADTERIHQWLLSEFPGLTLVSQQRGPREHTVPVDASSPGAFWRYPVSCLIPVWAKPLIQVEDIGDRFPGELVVTAQRSPIIEYHPCHWDETTSTVTRGRFYWAYNGEVSTEAQRQLDKLFRWVQRNTVTAENMSFRFFPAAATNARYVRQNLTGSLRNNPLFHENIQSISDS